MKPRVWCTQKMNGDIAFEIDMTWEFDDEVSMPLHIDGIRKPVVKAVKTGNPEDRTPAEGGELEDVKIRSGARLPRTLELALLDSDRFVSAIHAAINS